MPTPGFPSVLYGVGAAARRTFSLERAMRGKPDHDICRRASVNEDDPASLRALAEQCRRLARGASTEDVAGSLREIAGQYEEKAARLEAARPAPQPRPT